MAFCHVYKVGVHILLLVITAHAAVLPIAIGTNTMGLVLSQTGRATTVQHKDETTFNPIDDIDITTVGNEDALSLSDTTIHPRDDNEVTSINSENNFEETTVVTIIETKEDILEDTTIQDSSNDASDITEGPINFKITQTEDKVTKEPEELVDLTKKLDIQEVITLTTEQVQTENHTMAITLTTEQVQTKDHTMPTTTDHVLTEDQTVAMTTTVPVDNTSTTTGTEQLHTNTKITNPNSNTMTSQPRIINHSGMIFGHRSNGKEDDEDQYTKSTTEKSSMINFGGPTNNRGNDEAHEEKKDERKSSKVNFGGPTAGEETTIESLNEVFSAQANDIFNESKNAKKCQKYNLLYSLKDQTCYMPTTTGPCEPQTHWFVAQDDTSIGVCRPRLCTREDSPFLYKGVCSSVHVKCGPGERLYNDRFGEGFCGCEQGFLYHESDKKCYRENLQGPCKDGKQWVKKRGTWMEGICRRRGCGMGRVMWEDGRCYKVEEGEGFEYCAGMVEGEVKQVEEKTERVLGCYLEINVRSIAPVFQGRKCRRGRMWNKYRRRCVRTYGWGR